MSKNIFCINVSTHVKGSAFALSELERVSGFWERAVKVYIKCGSRLIANDPSPSPIGTEGHDKWAPLAFIVGRIKDAIW